MDGIGLAKSAPRPHVVQEPISVTKTEDLPVPSQVWDGLPMSMYKYFNCDFFDAGESHKDDMKVLLDYANYRGASMDGDVLQKLEELQIRLGQPHVGETRLRQLSTWARMDRNIRDMQKQKRVLERGY